MFGEKLERIEEYALTGCAALRRIVIPLKDNLIIDNTAFNHCENLLENPSDDCVNTSSRMDPDTIYDGDGPNCILRKQFHANIRDIYNPILRDVLQEEYIDTDKLPNAKYIDAFNVQFEGKHVNGGDCFHPSEAGHALLSDEEWCTSQWSAGDTSCSP